jgi:site-specific DNA-methyltransferase (adenine-specific)
MMKSNALFYGDNLVWLRDRKYFPDESVDLIYLDPPFNSKADYNVLFNEPGKGKSQAQIRAFDDTWDWSSESSGMALNELAQNKPQVAEFISWVSQQGKNQESMAAYLSMMSIRLIELHRILKQTGSLYIHCDPTASHYIKMVLDTIFGEENYRNEIIWKRQSAHSDSRGYGAVHDTLLFYVKSNEFIWNQTYQAYDDDYVEQYYRYNDRSGRQFMSGDLGAAGLQGGGYEYEWKGIKRVWRVPYETMERLDSEGRIFYTRNGIPRIKRYLDEAKGMPVQDVWTDLESLRSWHAERLGYPTQKPLTLLERIILSSCNKDDIVLDPFCGCGTTIDAAQKLERNWLGIDVTWLAIDLVEKRLKATYGSKVAGTYEVHGKPYDVASAQALANRSKKEFEIWAVTSLVGAGPREHDGGVDGIFGFVEKDKKTRIIIVQVKGGDVLNPGMVRDLIGTLKKEGAAIGLLITLKEPTKGMMKLAIHSEPYKSELWDREFPSIQIRTVGELLEGKVFDLPPTQSPLKKAKLAKGKGQQIHQGL